ncbi:MAG: ABC-2 transporter permease [Flexilinea sp.]|jgi:hypothetical protein
MKDIVNIAKLNYLLIKPYQKSLLKTLLIPLFFTAINRSLISGISFAMVMMAMTSVYTFQIEEKNQMARLFCLIPAEKSKLVIGRYFFVILTGLFAWIFSIISNSILLRIEGVGLSGETILIASLTGLLLYIVFIAFQLPGFYKYGPIRGKAFVYIPIVGLLLLSVLIVKTESASLFISKGMNPVFWIAALVVCIVLLFLGSCMISIGIYKKKEF